MPDHPPTQRFAPPAPGDRILVASLPCIGCGYDLRSMGLQSRCPECARPAIDSLASLHLADRGDIARLVLGLRFLFWPAVVAPLLAAAMVGIDIYRQTDGPQVSLVGLLACAILGPCLACFGAVRVACPVRAVGGLETLRPGFLVQPAPLLKGAAVAYAACSSACGIILAFVLVDIPHREPAEPVVWVMSALAILAGCAWGVRNLLLTARSAVICARSNRVGLRRLSILGSYVAAASILVFLGYAVVMLLARFDAIPWSFSQRASWMAVIFMIFQVAALVINGAGIGWLLGWPVGLTLLARHLTPISRRPLHSASDLLGVQQERDGLESATAPTQIPPVDIAPAPGDSAA